MKTLITLMAAASILSMASAAPSPAAAAAGPPKGYILTSRFLDCAQPGGATQTDLTQDKCVDTADSFVSFQAGDDGPESTKCPGKTKPQVNVYREVNCGGNPAGTPALTYDGEPSTCQNVNVLAPGKSAKFVCV